MNPSSDSNSPRSLGDMARVDFENAIRKGFWRSVFSWFTKSNNELLPFDEVRKRLPMRGQHDAGMQQIPIDRIVGSLGRYHDFDRAFLPRQDTTRGRWESIDIAHLQEISLPAIEVYQVGEIYFVKDGNHRVSVARERGQAFIDAHVIVMDVAVPLGPETDIADLIRKQEEAEFLDQTDLDRLRPGTIIRLSLAGGYEKLLEHINTHRWFMGERRQAEVPYAEAVMDWYDWVYLPLVTIIRSKKILTEFPGRTEADLYLWIIEHLWYLREESQREVSMEEAVDRFMDTYSPRPFGWVMDILSSLSSLLKDEDDSSKQNDRQPE